MAQKGFSVTNYIDDIIGHSVVSKSHDSFKTLRGLLLELGFDISENKVVEPATKVTCLGVDIDTVQFTVSITPKNYRNIDRMSIMGQKKTSMYQKTATISVKKIALHNQVRSSFKTFS